MSRRNQKGEGKLGTLLVLVLLAAIGLAAWNVAPVYIDHYGYTDKVEQICRTPRYRGGDEEIRRLLMEEARRKYLDEWIYPESFRIRTTDRGRRIEFEYQREAEILPGWKKTFKFSYTAEQPLI